MILVARVVVPVGDVMRNPIVRWMSGVEVPPVRVATMLAGAR